MVKTARLETQVAAVVPDRLVQTALLLLVVRAVLVSHLALLVQVLREPVAVVGQGRDQVVDGSKLRIVDVAPAKER